MLLLKISILTAALYGLYHWGYRTNACLPFNRWFLLAGMGIAIVLPFFSWEYEVTSQHPVPLVWSEAFVSSKPATTENVNALRQTFPWLGTIYGLGISFFLGLRLRDIRKIFSYIRLGKSTYQPEYTLVETSISSPFSFLRYILLPEKLPQESRDIILYHERVHVAQHHYLDLWLCEVFCILQWFNPFAWFYKHAVMENHEFLADYATSRFAGAEQYKQTLANFWLQSAFKHGVHPFAYSTRKSRLWMLKQANTIPFRKRGFIALAGILMVYGWVFATPVHLPAPVQEGDIQLVGTITDQDSQSMIGVSVVIPSKRKGTISDFDGNYLLEAGRGDTLSIGFPGYKTRQFILSDLPIEDKTFRLDVQLTPSTSNE